MTRIKEMRIFKIIGEMLKSVKKHRLKILVGLTLIFVILTGVTIWTVVTRQAKLKDYDSRFAKTHVKVDDVLKNAESAKEKVAETEQGCEQSKQTCEELEVALYAHNNCIVEQNSWLAELDVRPRTLYDGGLGVNPYFPTTRMEGFSNRN